MSSLFLSSPYFSMRFWMPCLLFHTNKLLKFASEVHSFYLLAPIAVIMVWWVCSNLYFSNWRLEYHIYLWLSTRKGPTKTGSKVINTRALRNVLQTFWDLKCLNFLKVYPSKDVGARKSIQTFNKACSRTGVSIQLSSFTPSICSKMD